MYYVLTILLYRPYLSRAPLYPQDALTECLVSCTGAATRIARLVRDYTLAFTTRRAPYFIAYSAYVAATILIRVVSRAATDHPAKDALRVCLQILVDNERINPGVKRANHVVARLRQSADLEIGLREARFTLEEILGVDVDLTIEDIQRIIQAFSSDREISAAARADAESSISRPLPSMPPQGSFDVATPIANTPQGMLLPDMTHDPNMTSLGNLYPEHDNAMADIIFGLHGSEFHQWWPDFEGYQSMPF